MVIRLPFLNMVCKLMITGLQIKCARIALRWSMEDLARHAGVGVQTVVRLERSNEVPDGRIGTLRTVQACFEAAGIEFIGAPDEGPGIRYWPERATKR